MEKLSSIAIVFACAIAAPYGSSAFAAPTEAQMNEARQRYDRGLKLYNEGAYDAALVEMQRAYELAPSFKILYNLGLIHRQLNDYAAALKVFRRYLQEGGNKVPKDKRAEVTTAITELEKRVATITVEVDVAGAEVSVDDAPVGTSPLPEPLLVNAGKRRISAKIPGKPAAVRIVTVAGTDTQTVKLELGEPKPATTTETSPTTTKAPETKPPVQTTPPKREVPWVLWGVTGGLAAATAVTGIIAFSSSRDLASQRDTPGASRDDLDAASRKTKTWALVTDVLLVGTVAMAGVSLYVTLKEPTAKDTASVRAVVAPNGFSLVGRF
ncbi:MAG: hypothetical protein ACXWUG_14355 [Polyangiales bacterium]